MSISPTAPVAICPPPSSDCRIDNDVETYCLCGYGDGEMIFCDSEDKRCIGKHWYHLECLGISGRGAPRGEWRCPDCKQRAAAKLLGSSAASTASSRKREAHLTGGSVLVDDRVFVLEPSMKRGKVLTTSSLVKVDAAERQSRKAMEDILINAKLLQFADDGKVVDFRLNGSAAPFPSGLCRFHLRPEHHVALQSLHRVIVQLLAGSNRLTPWAGVAESDARKRGYAFLPASYGHFGKNALQSAGVNFHAAEKTSYGAKKDETANWKSCVRLSMSDITDDHIDALESVIASVRAAVPERYRECVALERLQALQPNLHYGLDHLPGISAINCVNNRHLDISITIHAVHLDSPLHDGFGVVIVTVCVHLGAQILLVPSDDLSRSSKSYVFETTEGDVYVLSDASRNIFDHGVICANERRSAANKCRFDYADTSCAQPLKRKRASKKDPKNIGRESLNLRFSIHGNKPGMPFYVGTEIPVQIK